MNRFNPDNNPDAADKAREFVNQDHDKILSGMQPFTITITDPAEAATLFNAAIKSAVQWNNEASKQLAELCSAYVANYGDEKGVAIFLEEADKRGYKFPKWFGPLHTYLVGIADKNYKQFKKEEE